MTRRLALFISVAAFALSSAFASVSATALASSTPQGKLSSSEYVRLHREFGRYNAAVNAKPVSWRGARAACSTLGSSTLLLTTQRIDCAAGLQLVEHFSDFNAQFARCGGTPVHRYTCAAPLYEAIDRVAGAYYASEANARSQALSRGLTGACLKTLAATPAQLTDESAFAEQAKLLDGDVQLIVLVDEGKVPSSQLKIATVEQTVKRFERLGAAVLETNRPSDLAACSH